MRYQSTVIGQLLKVLPRGMFERMAARHHVGRAKRGLSEWSHLVAMVMAQLSGAASLRDLERLIERHPGTRAHLGLARIRRATLADANACRPAGLFEELAGHLAQAASRCKTALRLIDATRIFAGKRIESWSKDGAIKLHVVYDPEGGRPVCFAVSDSRVNDITAAKAMPIEPGSTYVFDKGYYDFGFWARLDAAGCRFVTRLKKNSPLHQVSQRPTEGGTLIIADRVGRLSARLASRHHNPYDKPLRAIDVAISSGRVITLLTNDLDSPASDIAALYKARWQVELFFKWIKQNLRIKRFLGTSRNAVTIQILTALIAYLILRSALNRGGYAASMLAAIQLVARTILQRRPLDGLLNAPPDPLATPPNQLVFAL